MIDTRVGPLDYQAVARGYMRYREVLMRDLADAAWNPDDPDQAAYDALEDAVSHAAPAVAWELVLTLLRSAPDEELGNFGAGPLEDVVRTRAPVLIDAIEAEAERDPRFRWALGCVWLSRGDMPDDVLARVVQASGGAIKPLPPLEELERRRPLSTESPMSEAMDRIEPDRIADGPAMLLGGLRRMHSYRDAQQGMVAQWEEFVRMGPVPGQRGATTYGVMCGAWPAEQRFEYMTGVEVESLEALPPEYGRMRVPPQRYAVFTHHGHVSTLHTTWDAIWHEWLPRSGYRMANTPEFERYDERFDPRTGSGVVEIWCSIEGS